MISDVSYILSACIAVLFTIIVVSSSYILRQSICVFTCVFFFQAEDGIRDLVRSRGLGDVYKRQVQDFDRGPTDVFVLVTNQLQRRFDHAWAADLGERCLLYTSDAADERSSVDLGGRRIIKKKKKSRT